METINQNNSGSSGLGAEKLSALIVDDNAAIRLMHKIQLKKRGFCSMGVKNGREAVDLYSDGKYYDIIIMDMEMPVMNGIEATRELREMGVDSVIFGATASTCNIDIENFKEAGLEKCYAKPLSGSDFDDMIQIQALKKSSIMIEDK